MCSQGSLSGSFSGTTMNCEDVVAPLDSIRSSAAASGASVTFDPGTDPATAAAVAAKAKVAVVFAYQKSGEGADLTNLNLQGGGDALIEAVAAANPHTVVVMELSSAVVMPWLSKVQGVVEAWYPGDQQGPAIADLLFGRTDFSGKLPMTFPASLTDLPERTTAQYPGVVDANGVDQVSFSGGLAVGYKWYQSQHIAPLFPFGYGLSYTEFRYSQMRLTTGHGQIRVSADVTNTGHRAGTEVPQVYLTLPAHAGEPGSRLVGFDRMTLRPGSTERVTSVIAADASNHPLSIWDTAPSSWSVQHEIYRLGVGGNAKRQPLTAVFAY